MQPFNLPHFSTSFKECELPYWAIPIKLIHLLAAESFRGTGYSFANSSNLTNGSYIVTDPTYMPGKVLAVQVPYIYLHLHTSTYIYLHLHTSTYIYIHLPTFTYIYLHLHTSTHIYLHLHTSTYIYLHLHTSTYIYIHLPTFTYI